MLCHNVDILLGFALKDSCLNSVILSQYFMVKKKNNNNKGKERQSPNQTKGDRRRTRSKLLTPQRELIPQFVEGKQYKMLMPELKV